MSHTATEYDPMSRTLRALASRDDASAPYDFAEFQRRATARAAGPGRGLERVLRVAAMVAPVALLLTIAGVEHRRGAMADDAGDVVAVAASGETATVEPALVRVAPTARVIDLEDRIAWLDTMISEAPAAGLSPEERAQLASGRDALAGSLQRVRYAQALLGY